MNESIAVHPPGCGCCEIIGSATPETIVNREALRVIRYRVGTFSSFRRAMVADIARAPELRNWSARRSDDFGIALLGMWAYLGDILTFYQERIANEAFLRTARLDEMLHRFAHVLYYRPSPGVAATTQLLFTMEKGKRVDLPGNLLVQSVPRPGEKPQKFETAESLRADAYLNEVRATALPTPFLDGGSAFLRPDVAPSAVQALSPGDHLVFVLVLTGTDSGARVLEDKIISALTTSEGLTNLSWSPTVTTQPWDPGNAVIRKWTRKFRLFGYNAPASYLRGQVAADGLSVTWTSQPVSLSVVFPGDASANPQRTKLYLDAAYDDVKVGSHLLLWVPPQNLALVTRAAAVGQELTKDLPSWGPLRTTVTTVEIDAVGLSSTTLNDADVRSAVLYELTADELKLWGRRIPGTIPAGSDTIYVRLTPEEEAELTAGGIPERFGNLVSGRKLFLDDREAKCQLISVQDTALVHDANSPNLAFLRVSFTPATDRPLDTTSAVFRGNVVRATHGETVRSEVLGSGDAASAFQVFGVRKNPVTYVPKAGAPHGAQNTLRVWIGGLEWHEVETLFARGPDDRVFTATVGAEGSMTVAFGDGLSGSRLLTGRNNVLAAYRQGIGREGNVRANSLTTLLKRPTGLKAVTNPFAAAGGADAESKDMIRENAPNTVRTFGRIVSLRDFEDAARAFAGVAKARARWEWSGEELWVHLVVAGDGGAQVVGEPYDNLVNDLNSRRDTNLPLLVETYQEVPIELDAWVLVDPDYIGEDVRAAAEKSVRDFLSFDNLDLGRSVNLSDVYRVLQSVEGVIGVDVDVLRLADTTGMTADELRRRGIAFGMVDGAEVPNPVQGRLHMFPNEVATITPPNGSVAIHWRFAG